MALFIQHFYPRICQSRSFYIFRIVLNKKSRNPNHSYYINIMFIVNYNQLIFYLYDGGPRPRIS